ncbi:FAD-dependent oxidoreductase [Bacillus sp. FJAT-45350]|uniref:FAD-dependent oxidoreductase n=1 Tax=Bacillus sp. FJAT-45350 TaxID=2011014 RepID=UPI000BB85642|nr:NAD(P)/FAD-dependent oxidoreductase [Bacillus sp. FJAT-45350]
MKHYQVVIIGGGVAGLTLALKLVPHNISVLLVEKVEGEYPLYKGELLQPKSLQIFESIGVGNKLDILGKRIPHVRIKELKTSNSKSEEIYTGKMRYDILDHPYHYAMMVPHEQIRQLLYDKAKEYSSFELCQPAEYVGLIEEQKVVRIKTKSGEREVKGEFIIGADGRGSRVRKHWNVKKKEYHHNHQFLTVSFQRPPELTESVIYGTESDFLGLFLLPDEKVRTVLKIAPDTWRRWRKEGIHKFHEAYHQIMPEMKGYVDKVKNWKQIQLMIPAHFTMNSYTNGNQIIIGDAAHTVHPMAGEGMNLAVQDSDVLGELLIWMHKTERLDARELHWFEKVRKPRAEYLSKLSYYGGLAYSYPHSIWQKVRIKGLSMLEKNSLLHFKQVMNISGLGLSNISPTDFLYKKNSQIVEKQKRYYFQKEEDYPWLGS